MTPKNWNQQAHNLWTNGEKEKAIQSVVTAINEYGTDKPKGLLVQFSYYLFLIGDFTSTADVLKKAYALYPDDTEILQNLVASLTQASQNQEALHYALLLQQKDPKNFLVHDCLAKIYSNLKEDDKARIAGTQSLTLKDAKYGHIPADWEITAPLPKISDNQKQNVISFSLFGQDPLYLRGALLNLLLAPTIYPDWALWFWLDDTVPQEFQDLIIKLGAIVKKQKNNQPVMQKLCWRFLISDEKNIGYFLVRDVDFVINIREAMAVNQWMKSGRYFHIMRDWWTHTDLILAGMWGGVGGVLPNMKNLIQNYDTKNIFTPNIDQWFLRDCIWKYVKSSLITHDRFFNFMQPLAWPSYKIPSHSKHVGQNEALILSDNHQYLLTPWLKQYSCLQ